MEEEQGRSVHENNIMGEAIFKTLQYTQRIRLFEKKDHFNTWERKKTKEMIVVSFSTSTWERKSFSHERERHDCFFSCCCFHMGQRIVFHNEKEMDCFFFFIIFACHMMKHRICFPKWKKEKDGLLLLLLLPHEEKDYKFHMKDMIASFVFTWDQGFVSHMKVWSIRSYCSCYILMGK